MLLLMASACSLTWIVLSIAVMGKNCSKYGSRALKIQQNFHVLLVGRIEAGEIPVLWLISLTETSFSSAKNVTYACSSALKARVKTLHRKWNSQTLTIDHLNQERQTSWFSLHQLLCCHLFAINYLLLFFLTLFDKEITPVPVVKDLGVLLDTRLGYNQHITETASKCLFKLYQINRIKHLLDRKTLLLVIN